ncbi:hypothetical protein DFS21_102475 [Pseudomonas sp. 2848]|uniref:hypothetical protein n=1 Tax=Pseudomonas TaxID=286 RepID=UPI000DB6FAF5|nr:hypothetical protein [Pseudomonas sp. 2848]PZW85236.1 hypothetical protein DFS21_102475 [Pseudomonas sp. 2848]
MKGRCFYIASILAVGNFMIEATAASEPLAEKRTYSTIAVTAFRADYLQGERCTVNAQPAYKIEMCDVAKNKEIRSLMLTQLPNSTMTLCLTTESNENALCITGSRNGQEFKSREIIVLRPQNLVGLSPYRVSSYNPALYDKVAYVTYTALRAVTVSIYPRVGSSPICKFAVDEGGEVDVRAMCPGADFSKTDLRLQISEKPVSGKVCFQGATSSDSACYSTARSEFEVPELGGPARGGQVELETRGDVRGKLQKVKY